LDNEFVAYARSDADARRLATIPGSGVLNATALMAAIGNGETFARGRDLAAWLGLAPRQVTTGVLPVLAASSTPLGSWLKRPLKCMHKNAAVVALANKLARIVWIVLRRGAAFDAAAASNAAA
jgi:transposase